jgi:hypothetical protein
VSKEGETVGINGNPQAGGRVSPQGGLSQGESSLEAKTLCEEGLAGGLTKSRHENQGFIGNSLTI